MRPSTKSGNPDETGGGVVLALITIAVAITLVFGLVWAARMGITAVFGKSATPAAVAHTPTPKAQRAVEVVASPNVGSGANVFASVAVAASNAIWAVGTTTNASQIPQTLAAYWNGATWIVTPGKNPDPRGDTFTSVAALGTANVWAVGSSGTLTVSHTLIEHWDGAVWHVIPSPNPGKQNTLAAVAALTPSDIWAVGSWSGVSGVAQALIEHWNGVSWSVVPSPAWPDANHLNGVSAFAPSDVWAVGEFTAGNQASSQALIEHWDGATWRMLPSPAIGVASALQSVSADTAADAWAVRTYSITGADHLTLIEHWSGAAWAPVANPTADSSAPDTCYYTIAAHSESNIWTAGQSGGKAIIAHWDGATWRAVPVMPPGASSELRGVAIAAPDVVWFVGDASGAAPSAAQTLALTY